MAKHLTKHLTILNVSSLFQRATMRAGAPLVAIVIAAIALMLPAFIRGFPAGDDAAVYFRRVVEFREALAEPGVFYPRWLASANDGGGSPAMLYYPPQSFFVTSAFGLLTKNILTAMSLSCWLGLTISGISMYLFTRHLFDRAGALAAALLYMAAPYHLFDLYQGSALAEFWSFAWIPLIFDGVYRISKGKGWGAVVYLAASSGLLLFTHTPLSFAVTLLLPVFALVLTRDWRHLAQVAMGLVWGATLAAIYLAPVAFERGYVHLENLLKFDYQGLFLLEHLRLAYKTTWFAPDPSRYSSVEPLRLPVFLYQIKIDQVMLGFLPLLALTAVALLVSRRAFANDAVRRKLALALGALVALSLFLCTRPSTFIWRLLPQLSYLLFPSRWLVIVTAGSAVLVVTGIHFLWSPNHQRVLVVALLIIAVGLALTTSGKLIWRMPDNSASFDANDLRGEVPEYRTIWWNKLQQPEEPLPPVRVVDGQAAIDVIDEQGIYQHYVINVVSPATLQFRTFYFPGWQVRMDGMPVQVAPGDDGRIQVAADPGEHDLTLCFEDTPIRRAGRIVSVVSLLMLLALPMAIRRRRRMRDVVVG